MRSTLTTSARDQKLFRDLDKKRIHRGVFRSVPQLIDAIMDYVEHHSVDPEPFIWMKTTDEIIEKVGRARLVLDNTPTEWLPW